MFEDFANVWTIVASARDVRRGKLYPRTVAAERVVLFRDAEGKATRMVGAMQDITKQHQKEQMLKSLNEKLIEISWMQSHVVRAPLSRIMGLIPLIENAEENDSEIKEMLKYLAVSAYELDDVIKKITKKTYLTEGE